MRLLSLSCFWQNDQPNGLGFTLLNDDNQLETILSIFRESYSAMWAEAVRLEKEPELAFDLRAQLYQFAIRKKNLSNEELYLAIANVWLLVEMGDLKNDEFNGIQYVYET